MRTRFRRKKAVRESGREHDLELQTLGLMHGHHLHGVTPRHRGLCIVGGTGEESIQGAADLRKQRLRAM